MAGIYGPGNLDLQYSTKKAMELFGYAWDDVAGFTPFMDFWSFYEELVRIAPPESSIVEVGCYHGRSLICLGSFAKQADKGLQIYGVDSGVMGANTSLRENVYNAKKPIRLIEQPSVEAAKHFADGSVFSVFIDGGHLHQIVADDIRAWMPKIAPGGWLCGHDFIMYTVHQPVMALFGDRLIRDDRWQDIWIVPKCEPDWNANIYTSYAKEVQAKPGAWKP